MSLKKQLILRKKIYTIETPDNPRALPAEELAKAARVYNSSAESTKEHKDAVEKAFSCAGDDENQCDSGIWFTFLYWSAYRCGGRICRISVGTEMAACYWSRSEQ